MENGHIKTATELDVEAERNSAREVVIALSRGEILLQNGEYFTEEDMEADREFMRKYKFRYPKNAKET